MIKSMLRDLRVFMVLMFIFILAQGIILQSLKNPNSDPPDRTDILVLFYDIIFIPYFSIFGEIYANDFNNDGKNIITNLEEYKNSSCEQVSVDCCVDMVKFDKLNETVYSEIFNLEPCYKRGKVKEA